MHRFIIHLLASQNVLLHQSELSCTLQSSQGLRGKFSNLALEHIPGSCCRSHSLDTSQSQRSRMLPTTELLLSPALTICSSQVPCLLPISLRTKTLYCATGNSKQIAPSTPLALAFHALAGLSRSTDASALDLLKYQLPNYVTPAIDVSENSQVSLVRGGSH